MFDFIPFILLLLSIAILGNSHIWHLYYKYITLGISILSVLYSRMYMQIYHILIDDYMPFIILISSLFIISSNIIVRMQGKANVYLNVKIFIIGMILSSFLGTMGSSMIMIHTLLHINKDRYLAHTLICFIILVSNVSGTLSSIADPPLFLGYLSGVPFLWPSINLFIPFIIISTMIIIMYIILDYFLTGEKFTYKKNKLQVKGIFHLIYIFLIVILTISNVYGKDILILSIAFISYIFGDKNLRKENDFSILPIIELIFTFFAIFITSVPIMEKIQYISFDLSPFQCFWLVGLISSILDNAPTYMIFYHLIGGYESGNIIMLKAISLGSVLMGGMTYIGNAPNLMVRAITIHKQLKAPSFLSYIILTVPILGFSIFIYSYHAF